MLVFVKIGTNENRWIHSITETLKDLPSSQYF